MSNIDPNRTKVDPTRARQGSKGSRVLIILVAALALALIAGFGMGIFGASQPDENIGGSTESGISTEPAAPATTTGGAAPAVVAPGGTTAPAVQ